MRHVYNSTSVLRVSALLPLVLGLLAFVLMVGPNALKGSNIAWLAHGDPAFHYLGWLYFRYADWGLPPGINPNYGIELGSSIVYADSIPLMALLFKPLSGWLPEPFQYFGYWLLACFLLHSWFGWKLAGLVSSGLLLRAVITLFFLFSPPMAWRLYGHLSLVAHFLLLAALYLCLRPGIKSRQCAWGALLITAALVHAYLLAMVIALWLADLLQRGLLRQLLVRMALVEVVGLFALLGLVCWLAGYFVLAEGASIGGYGNYRMNLLALVDASGWSRILPDIAQGEGDYEGFNYLGLGMLVLLACSLVLLCRNPHGLWRAVLARPVLLILMLALTLFALTHNLGVAGHTLVLPLPAELVEWASVLRGSGRLFWPVYYLIMLVIFFIVVRGTGKTMATLLLGAALVVQLYDTQHAWSRINHAKSVPPAAEWPVTMPDPFWSQAATRYQRLRWLLAENAGTEWMRLGYYAGNNGWSTDAVNLARVDSSALISIRQRAEQSLRSGDYPPDTLFVLDERVLALAALSLDAQEDVLARIDGLYVLAPGWKACTECLQPANLLSLQDLPSAPPLGQRLATAAGAPGSRYLALGWSVPEPWGTWSAGERVDILLPIAAGARMLRIEVNALIAAGLTQQRVVLRVNGRDQGTRVLTEAAGQIIEIDIPRRPDDALGRQGWMHVEWLLPDAAKPQDVGLGSDDRRLAVGVIAIIQVE